MPETANFGFEYETPQSKPGITLTGDADGSAPILAEQVDDALAAVDSRLTGVESSAASNTNVITQLLASLVGDNYNAVNVSEDAVDTGSTWVDLATVGPSVTLTLDTFTPVLVFMSAEANVRTDNVSGQASVDISGASIFGPSSTRRLVWDGHPANNNNTHATFFVETFSPGTSLIRMKYQSGVSHTVTFSARHLLALPLLV